MSNLWNKMNIWSMLRLIVIIALMIQVLDAAEGRKRKRRNRKKRVERNNPGNVTVNTEIDRKNRKQRNRERLSRHKEDHIEVDDESNWPAPTLVQLFLQQQNQGHKTKAAPHHKQEGRKSSHDKSISSDYMIKQFKKKLGKKSKTSLTELPPAMETKLVYANVDFLINRHRTRHFFAPTTIGAVDEAGEVIHSGPGKFGMHSEARTVNGRLIHIADAGRDSHFGCGTEISNKYQIPKHKRPWVALIARGHCSFFVKIRLAEQYNASAVIIYNDKTGEIPEMFTLGTDIVSVSIGKHDGHKVAKIVDSGVEVIVNITLDDEPATAATETSLITKINDFVLSRESYGTGTGGASSCSSTLAVTILFAILATLFQNHVTH